MDHLNAFHILGGAFAVWAVIVAVCGFTVHRFPGRRIGEVVVSAISVLLAVAAVSSAIITAAIEDDEERAGERENPGAER